MTSPTVTAKGKLLFLDESSNMGGFWAFMPDNTYIDFPADTYILHNGDLLTIYDANGANTLWSGTINLIAVPLMTQAIDGHWIRNTQQGIDVRSWATWFEKEFPAQITTNNVLTQYPNYQG